VGDGMTLAATDAVLAVLRESGTYYKHDNEIVSVNDRGDILIHARHDLKQQVERLIHFQKFDGRTRKIKAADCSDEVINRVLGSTSRELPELKGVSLFPTMTATGRVLDQPGYDVETGLLMHNPEAEAWEPVKLRPSDNEVLAALDYLWKPFSMFPYDGAVSRGIALAAILTAAIRKGLPTAPMFLISAPTKGTGKSLLGASIATLAGEAVSMKLPSNDVELDKVLVSALRAGVSVLFFDNVTGVVGSESLDRLLTSATYTGRILGESMMAPTLPANQLVIATGNNAYPNSDTSRRCLICNIDAQREHPLDREFPFNPLTEVGSNKRKLLSAALTILAGGLRAVQRGDVAAPADCPAFGSFEGFEARIRRAVLWVAALEKARGGTGHGFGDPLGNLKAQITTDDESEVLGNFLQALHRIVGGTTAKEMFNALTLAGQGRAAGALGELGAVLLDALPKARGANDIGFWLRARARRFVGELRLDGVVPAGGKVKTWFANPLAAG
jgi:hypothetical protein